MVRYLADIYQAVSSTIKGLSVTFKHLWSKPVTQQYPDERWMLPARFKGFVVNDMNKCNACNQCVKACPVSCIYLETEGKGKDRVMTRYAIDYNKCIWCGFCVEPCPDDALSMSHDYDHSVYFRDSLVYEYVARERPIPTNREARVAAGLWVKPKGGDGDGDGDDEKAARAAKARAAKAARDAAKATAAPGTEMPASAPEEPPCESELADEPGDGPADRPADRTQGRDT